MLNISVRYNPYIEYCCPKEFNSSFIDFYDHYLSRFRSRGISLKNHIFLLTLWIYYQQFYRLFLLMIHRGPLDINIFDSNFIAAFMGYLKCCFSKYVNEINEIKSIFKFLFLGITLYNIVLTGY